MAKRTKSALKRALVADRNRERNVAVKSEVKTRIKRAKEAAASGEDEAKISEILKLAVSRLDSAARKNVIHPNAAARRKSRLIKALRSGGVSI